MRPELLVFEFLESEVNRMIVIASKKIVIIKVRNYTFLLTIMEGLELV